MTTKLNDNQRLARAALYRLLARLWVSETDLQLLRQIGSQPLRDLFVAAGGVLPDVVNADFNDQLAIDFCQLFLGPSGHLPPYQSVWERGEFQGDAATSMKSFTDAVGYDTTNLPQGTMVDHLGVQLDVMGHYLKLRDRTPELDDAAAGERAYFAAHLAWPTRLLNVAGQRATTDFYRGLIEMTRDFLATESIYLRDEAGVRS